MARMRAGHVALVLGGALFLSGCEEGGKLPLFQKKPTDENAAAMAPSGATGQMIERDVEAPEVFEANEDGLWDGRPSLGGVWVAHPDVKDPERVIIRNTTNDKFVVGALFRREREIPGPRLQVSSDAAEALGLLAGSPSKLSVIALKREEVPEVVEAPMPTETDTLEAPEAIAEQSLDPVAAAAAAIDAAEIAAATGAGAAAGAAAPTATAAAAAPAPAKPKPVKSSLEKPFIQIGIFSVEENANRTGAMLRREGVVPAIKSSSANGKTYWRVVVGPASTSDERSTLLKKVKKLGFSDAYFVTR